jgi:hypothetical protein
VDTTHRELKSSAGRPRLGGPLGGGGLATFASLTALTTLSAFASEIHVVCLLFEK